MGVKIKVPFSKKNPDGTLIAEQKTGESMDFDVEKEEEWSVYKLEDGTKIKVKNTVVKIVKIDGEKTQEGEPVFALATQQSIRFLPNESK